MKISTCLSVEPVKFAAVPFKENFEENVKNIKEMGFDGIELTLRDPESVNQERILDTILSQGLKIPALGTGLAWGEDGLSFSDPDPAVRSLAVDRIYSHIEFAAKSGSVVIIGLLRGVVKSGADMHESFGWMRDCFYDCSKVAESKNVRIAFEPINRYETSLLNTVEEGLEFIASIGTKNLGMLLDTFHMNIEETSIEESIVKAGKKIFHFHYADSNRLYPGAGHLDFTSIMNSLYSTGYSGFVSGEHYPDPEPLTAVRRGLKYMRGLELDGKSFNR